MDRTAGKKKELLVAVAVVAVGGMGRHETNELSIHAARAFTLRDGLFPSLSNRDQYLHIYRYVKVDVVDGMEGREMQTVVTLVLHIGNSNC